MSTGWLISAVLRLSRVRDRGTEGDLSKSIVESICCGSISFPSCIGDCVIGTVGSLPLLYSALYSHGLPFFRQLAQGRVPVQRSFFLGDCEL